ncbi:hypothetical protein ACH4UV_20620 [Streptomyces sp. NPDC020802]|uniref:hypothetical protein n=1 Tax=Streptomyces sp. NPDC020802 TaxID=3365094 RepID=UPI003788EBCC
MPYVGNRADDEGTDVEIYIKPLTDTVHADTPTDAPEKLLALLDSLGFERKTAATAGPVYVWHEVPHRLTEAEKKRLATSAVPSLLVAGYLVNTTSATTTSSPTWPVQEAHDQPPAPHLGTAR